MASNCIGAITIPSAPNLLIQYSATGTGSWSTSIVGALYIRFSADGGKTWSAARKFVGTDGSTGAAGSSGGVIYGEYGTAISGGNATAATTSITASTLSETDEYLKVTAILTLRAATTNDYTVQITFGALTNFVASYTVQGDIIAGDNDKVKVEATITRLSQTSVLVESTFMQSGNPSSIWDCPTTATITGLDLDSGDTAINILTIDTLTTETPSTLNLFRVELTKKMT